MERDQEKMQFLEFFGIYKEAYMIMLSWRKIFSLITLTLTLPLSLVFLFHMEVSQVFFMEIPCYPKPHFVPFQYRRLITETTSSEFFRFVLFKLVYFALAALVSVHSTSAVVYTIASIYAGRDDVTFTRVVSVVPKVWKRLVMTYVCTFIALLVYDIVGGFMTFLWAITSRGENYGIYIYVVLVLLWSLYLDTVWQLANVVTVLEDSCGFKAMMKSNKLMKGKKDSSFGINHMLNTSFFFIQFLFFMVVVNNNNVSYVWKIACRVFCVLVLSHLFLLMFVVQTVLYFVCKSYQHEIIDKSTLAEHLEVLYQGGQEPVKEKDVQLQGSVQISLEISLRPSTSEI